MPLPQPTDYDDAIQNPQFAFIDDELKNSSNDGPLRFGMPGPVASGNFAIVYRLNCRNRRVAIKCFTREKKDQQLRYQLIHDHLAQKKLQWTIDFKYLSEGIRVKGKTHPIVKMEWIESPQTLLSFIVESLSKGRPIQPICDQFYQMVTDLKRSSIGHGDLQHANLIVSKGRLLLIDYDGMCVPKTQGLPSEEDGLPDYQHPGRKGGTLHQNLDHFPSLVIWTSLYALSIDSTLWQRWVRDDERLLFSRRDFSDPKNSSLIRELRSFGDSKMTTAVDAIVASSLTKDLTKIPHLIEVIRDRDIESLQPWWQTDKVASQATQVKAGEPPALPPWMTKTAPTTRLPLAFKGKVMALKALSGLSIGAIVLLSFFGLVGALAAIKVTLYAVLILASYYLILQLSFRRRPEVIERMVKASQYAAALDNHQQALRKLELAQAPYLKRVGELEKSIVSASSRIAKLEADITSVKQRSEQRLREFLHETAQKRVQVEKCQNQELAAASAKRAVAQLNYTNRITQTGQELKNAESHFIYQSNEAKKKAERARDARFSARFDSYIKQECAKVEIWRSDVSGVNTYSMNQNGFYTLADFAGYVGYDGILKHQNGRNYKIYGIGHVRAHKLDQWRKRAIEKIRQKIPTSERDAINRAVDAELQGELKQLELDRDTARQKSAMAKLAAKREYDQAFAQLETLEAEINRRRKASIDHLIGEESTFRANLLAKEGLQLEPLSRELWSLQSVVNPTKHKLIEERKVMLSETKKLSDRVKEYADTIEFARRDLAPFESLTFTNFVKHVLS